MASARKKRCGHNKARCLMMAVLLLSVMATSWQMLMLYHRHWGMTMEMKDNVAPLLSQTTSSLDAVFYRAQKSKELNLRSKDTSKVNNLKDFAVVRPINGLTNSVDEDVRTKIATMPSLAHPATDRRENNTQYYLQAEKDTVWKLLHLARYGKDQNPADAQKDDRLAANFKVGGFGPNLTTDESGEALCLETPPNLLGNVSSNVNAEYRTLKLNQVMARNTDLDPGGEWSPKDCVARYRLAIVIPYRDRLAHLTVLLAHLLPILKRQQLHFRIFVVEQYGRLTFNKGRIMNAAFKEALKMYSFDCVTFHDVDLIPEDDRNMYTCSGMPRHMSVAVDSLNYRLPYALLVGGALNFMLEHFQQVNGYSNEYWGWGGEDDDMGFRILDAKLRIFRPPANVARYKLLKTAMKRYHEDGLSNLNYTVQFIHLDPLYTHIMVDIGVPNDGVQKKGKRGRG
ncbi:beta-1,4-N-acetylgalactosaminyltransferase bre-4-like isoform X2 [Littorina saxatilis]|uniref:beta-1,4-N-acetylgalactosaminyltransferase bre-4-like isoform X2 n=1 Tax=Littorina saxatilis TaxID=31220 RepID=UPI0038B6A5F6